MAIVTCGPGCTHEDKMNGQCGDPQRSYEGAVLTIFERNGYDDSDFYAVVWDADASAIKTICYGSTSSWTYHNGARVDVTPEVLEQAQSALAEFYYGRFLIMADEQSRKPVKGSRVRSLTTRGKNVGVEGTVQWYGVDQYRSKYGVRAYRVGVKVDGESTLRYLPDDRVEVIQPVAQSDDAALRAAAESGAQERNWRAVYDFR
jgi:hypothetical protein